MRAIARLTASFALAGCAAAPMVAGDSKTVPRQIIAPYEVHEDCADLALGDRLDYQFESSDLVTFNIHYHDGSLIVMPITRERVTSDAGLFVPQLKKGYCLMWEAGASGATLAYRIVVRRLAR